MAINKRDSLAPAISDLRKEGKTWTEIGKALGVDPTTAHMAVDPAYAEIRRKRINYRRRQTGEVTAALRKAGDRRVSDEEARRALAAIPADTRGRTSRLMGDPLPGRSALDKRGSRR